MAANYLESLNWKEFTHTEWADRVVTKMGYTGGLHRIEVGKKIERVRTYSFRSLGLTVSRIL